MKLAHSAYNKSFGDRKNQRSFLAGNNEMQNYSGSYFCEKLVLANLSYDELTVTVAKKHMNDTMDYIASNNGVDSSILKKFVELALYNESLYGLNDLARIGKSSRCYFA